MTDAERIDGLAKVALQAMEMTETQLINNFALRLIVMASGLGDVDSAVREVLARPDIAKQKEEMTSVLRSLREELRLLAPRQQPGAFRPKAPRVN